MADYFCVCMMQYVSSMPCNHSGSWLTRKRYTGVCISNIPCHRSGSWLTRKKDTGECVSSMPCNRSRRGRKLICFRCRWPLSRVYDILVLSSFNNKFNVVSALFVHQPLTLPQKIDSREGWF